MNARTLWSILPPFAVIGLLLGWIALQLSVARAYSFSILFFALANLIVYTDALDFALRLYMRRRHTAAVSNVRNTADGRLSINLAAVLPPPAVRTIPASPYAIIGSVYNLEPELDSFMQAFGAFKNRVWLISDGSTDNTVVRLRQAKWRCIDDGINRRKPGALRKLLQQLPAHIETVVVIDPDVRIRGLDEGSSIDLDQFVREFQLSGAAAACPRIMIEEDGFLARFQAFEYALAFRVGRESLADFSITSGGVSIYRREALTRALREHSLSVYAEDLENAVILLGHGERIYYDGRLVVSTEGPGTLQRWFSQRVGWYHGLIKVYWERFPEILRISRRSLFSAYHYLLYVGGLSIAVHVLKMLSASLLLLSFLGGLDVLLLDRIGPRGSVANPEYFMAAIGSYLALGTTALFTSVPRAERAYTAPIVPLYLCYALVHIAPITVGFANFIALKLFGRRVYQDHYESRADSRGSSQTVSLVE